MRNTSLGIGLFSMVMLAGPAVLTAQDQPSMPQPSPTLQPQQQGESPRPWRRADDPPPPPAQTGNDRTADRNTPADPPYQAEPRDQYGAPMRGGGTIMGQAGGMRPSGGMRQAGGMRQDGGQNQPPPPQQQQMPAPPAQFTIKPGTYVTVRINQPLSSDHNQAGDAFSATLVRPIVVDGFVVAQRGETIGGRVEEAQKAGRVQGVSKLAIQLTDLTLVDGQQMPIKTQLISRSGPTSWGRDAAVIGGTTALGAATGAAAAWGRGAAIGAGAGAVVGIVGVLLTRGHATVIYPEQVLTFRLEAPVTIAAERSSQAFRYVEPEDYNQTYDADGGGQMAPRGPCGPYGCRPAPYPYYYGAAYPYWGPGIGLYYGPRFYGGGFFFRGGGFRHFR
jgi:hypothetical protein